MWNTIFEKFNRKMIQVIMVKNNSGKDSKWHIRCTFI